jgi:hypothetical protein
LRANNSRARFSSPFRIISAQAEADLRAHLEGKLAKFKIPARYAFTTKIFRAPQPASFSSATCGRSFQVSD